MKTKAFWPRFFSDWPAKVLSVAVALLLFFFFHLNRLDTRVISVPLVVQSNEDFVPGSQYPRAIKLSLRGESKSLFEVQEDDFRATVDFTAVKGQGLARATVMLEKRGNAVDIDPLEISPEPATISVTMERRSSRVVPVTPAYHGFLDPGFELKSFDLAPAEVQVEGPESAVLKIAEVTTEPIELAGRRGDFSVKAKLLRSSSLITITGADSAEFRGVVVRSVALKSWSSAVLVASALPETLALAEPLPAVRLRLKSSELDLRQYELPPDALYIDFSQIRKPGVYTLPIAAKLPEGLVVDLIEPSSLSVRVVARQGTSE
jgi:hypothetical protein